MTVLLAPPRPLLDVHRSALGRPWRQRCGEPRQEAAAAAIAQAHGLPEVLARVLAGRGVEPGEVPGFLQPRLRDLLPDPAVMVDMEAAAERLAAAVARRERVAIFGDYDVDGAASAALLAGALRDLGVPYRLHIPDRITEGYGPNVEAVRMLAREGARLLVTVDCGTAGHEPLAEAARLGLDVVVLDHHGAPEALPAAHAIVNPNRLDDLSGLGHLCAAGVVFLTLVALNRRLRRTGAGIPDLMAGLDLVALATVADVVPLRGLNRAFVRQGLSVMRGRGRLGLSALLDAAGLAEAPQAWHLGFLLGPRINAGGRIGDAMLGARLLLCEDPIEAAGIAAQLDVLNRERQAIEAAAVAEAEAAMALRLERDPDQPVLVASSPDWHPGVVGLIAARLKERFGRPAFAFALRADGTATGSGRSIPGADLGRAVRGTVEAGLAAKGGGHAMAAGVTLAAPDLDRFREVLAAELAASVAQARLGEALLVDGLVSAGGVQADLADAVERAGPFGQGSPEPVFALARHRVADARVVGTGHVKAQLRGRDGVAVGAIAFRAAEGPVGRMLLAGIGRDIHAAGSLARDRWRGGDRVELRLCDVAEAP
ncbi:single-stranded-DNA-specific exonuclease RecJ [Methylobacterium crusticola]|uniref:single-stranded-DNA-specific exonuclease RecJ n=1 Tax=Methylobacterium crusticola TaxID=1697972 RepID=UPI000FFB6B74|nr:single-stranded-DNA-specific exonuclease RecJ [Methylobacterium crusticola]